MCPTLNDAYLNDAYLNDAYLNDAYLSDVYLNDAYPGHDVDAAERTSANRVCPLRQSVFPRSNRRIRTLGRFSVAVLIGVGAATLIGVGATLSWQSYGGEMIRAWAPSLGGLSPVPPSAELQAQPKRVAVDFAVMERDVRQEAINQGQLAPKQDRLTQAFAALPAATQDINQNTLASAPLAPKAALVPLPKPRPALVSLSKPKAALVPPPEPRETRDIVLESNTSATASDSGWSGRFGRGSLDSDSRTFVGAAVR